MKRIMMAIPLFAALVAEAVTVSSGNTLGMMKIESGMGSTPVAVPFVKVGGGAKKVGELLAPDTLEAGDMMVVYDGGTYRAVRYDGEKWEGIATAAEGASFELVEGDPDVAAPAQGRAFWLDRTNNLSRAVFMAGQVPASYGATEVASSPMLLASPKAEAFRFYAEGAITGAAEGDAIIVPQEGGRKFICTFDGTKWKYTKYVEVAPGFPKKAVQADADDSCDIPMGMGFWYVRKGAEGAAPVVNW